MLIWYTPSRENQRQIAGLTDWVKLLTNERGIWANTTAEPQWKLDDTEGPYRVRFVASPVRRTLWALTLCRKKLEPTFDHIINFKVDPTRHSDEAGDVEPDVQSVINVEVPPWAESYELTSTETEGMYHWRIHQNCTYLDKTTGPMTTPRTSIEGSATNLNQAMLSKRSPQLPGLLAWIHLVKENYFKLGL